MWYTSGMITQTSNPHVAGALLAMTLLIAGTGCDHSDAQAAAKSEATDRKSAPASPVEASEKAPAQAPASAAQASYDEDAFSLSLDGPKMAKVGETVAYTIVLSAKNGYKVNQEYPVKFRFAEGGDLTPSKGTVTKEDAKLEKTKIELPAEVVFKKPGAHRVEGRLSFSVCTDDRCLIEKRDLALGIDAT